MKLYVFIVIFICVHRVYSCPGLLDPVCATYDEFLTVNEGLVSPGTDQILRSLDDKYSTCGPLDIDIRELTIAKAHEYFECGNLTVTMLTACYLTRIQHMNPYLKAVIEVNPDAMIIAAKIDLERMTGKIQKALYGIPILLKDNIATADKMETTAGATAMTGVKPKADSEVAKLIRENGGIILGKTNMAEWAGWRGFGFPFSWSGRGGQVLSPYVLISDALGSSTGSAVAVAANLALVAIGTETDQSIIFPSTVASLVGLKTTQGKVSTKGVIPLSVSQDVVGPMTRTVADAAIVFNAILPVEGNEQRNSKKLKSAEQFRIGIPRIPFWNTSDLVIAKSMATLERALESLRMRPDVNVVDPVSGDAGIYNSVSGDSEYLVFMHEFKYYVNYYLANQVNPHHPIQSLADVIEFNIQYPEEYNQDNLIEANATDGVLNSTYVYGRDQNIKYAREYLNSILDGNGLDAMVVPCQSEEVVLFISFGAIAGYPYITIPVGINEDGIPIGMCFLGRPNSDVMLLSIGSILEEVNPGRQQPTFTLK